MTVVRIPTQLRELTGGAAEVDLEGGTVAELLRLPGNDAAVAARSRAVGFACGLLWAAHPVHTAAVTYVSQRAEVLMATFNLLTVLLFLRGLRSGRPIVWRCAVATAANNARLIGTAASQVTAIATRAPGAHHAESRQPAVASRNSPGIAYGIASVWSGRSIFAAGKWCPGVLEPR